MEMPRVDERPRKSFKFEMNPAHTVSTTLEVQCMSLVNRLSQISSG